MFACMGMFECVAMFAWGDRMHLIHESKFVWRAFTTFPRNGTWMDYRDQVHPHISQSDHLLNLRKLHTLPFLVMRLRTIFHPSASPLCTVHHICVDKQNNGDERNPMVMIMGWHLLG